MTISKVQLFSLPVSDQDRARAFYVDVARLAENGLEPLDGIEEAPWGRFAKFNDPDGNGVILQATLSNANSPETSTIPDS